MDGPIGHHIFDFRAIGHHVRRNRMRLESRDALPFFDDDERVGAEGGRGAFDIDRSAIFNAASLRTHIGDIGVKRLQHRRAAARLRGDDS